MDLNWVLSLYEGARISRTATGECEFSVGPLRLLVRLPESISIDRLTSLVFPGSPLSHILDGVAPFSVAPLVHLLRHLVEKGWLRVIAQEEGRPLATVLPFVPWFRLRSGPLEDRPFLLSRFAFLHRVEGEFCLESPQAKCRIILEDPRAVRVIHALCMPREVSSLAAEVAISASGLRSCLALLAGTGMLTPVDPNGHPMEDADPDLQAWDFHDRLFHFRSRLGRHDLPSGATFPLAGIVPPPPAIKQASGKESVDLPRPDLATLEASDPPFAHVLESRKSIRTYGADPLTVAQLGEFLFRVGRVRTCLRNDMATPAGSISLDFVSRPYPAAGAMHELEIYPVVRSMHGIAPGLYHYDAVEHRLALTTTPNAAMNRLLEGAAQSAGILSNDLQVLFVVTARFSRIAWKYSSIAYSLVLKNVGVLYQTMYLAATAMHLAPCALGIGDPDLFAVAAGLEGEAESSVGEFLLGSAPATDLASMR